MSSAKNPNKKIYIAGPMTGLPNFNFEAFDRAAIHLKALGYEPLNPADNGREFLAKNNNKAPDERQYRQLLSRGREMIRQCSKIYLLKGWEKSYGARDELSYALIIGLLPEVEGSL